jgi:hypothetical protein
VLITTYSDRKVETDAANHQFGQRQLVVFSQAIGLLASDAIVYYSPMSPESINLTLMKERISLCMTMAMQTSQVPDELCNLFLYECYGLHPKSKS